MIDYWTAVWAAPAAVGFAMLFNVRRQALAFVAVIAVGARLVSDFGVNIGLSLIAADYVAALLVGIVAYSLAPVMGEASPVFAFAPIIPLIPGMYAISALEALANWITLDPKGADGAARFAAAASSGFTAAAIILALCLGAISPLLILPRHRTAED